MTREAFNHGWRYRTKVTAFAELGGSAASDWTEVLLPHDALLATERRPDAPRGETNGHFAGGAFEYVRTFHADEDLRGKQVLLEFDGVYRDAGVYVNGDLAGRWAFGYSRFVVRIDPYLELGADNQIRVECRTHLDSRWYAGAGIYRDVAPRRGAALTAQQIITDARAAGAAGMARAKRSSSRRCVG